MVNLKKIIAREWLILVSSILVGSILIPITYFQKPSDPDYMRVRKRLYEGLIAKRHFDPSTAVLVNPFDAFDRLKVEYLSPKFDLGDGFVLDIDTSVHLGTFEEFSKNLDDSHRRKVLYDSLSIKYDIESYETFESHISPSSMFSGFPKFFNHLFSKHYWFNTWLAVLLPYLVFQIFRSIIFSIKVLRK
jgi:hypothetical protein